ncbi:Ribosome biogenesis protein SLX9 [Plasmodiophora brassicae]|nr:hypothetical protein PBRA_007728 [Plasmodiophora brassicae]
MAKAKRKSASSTKDVTASTTAKTSKRAMKKQVKMRRHVRLIEKLQKAQASREPLQSLSSLVDSLNDSADGGAAPEATAPKVCGLRLGKRGLTKTIRKRVTDAESARMAQVLTHPAFTANPVQAIRDLLQSQQS